MIVDASAILAILNDESDAAVFFEKLRVVDDLRMSAATHLEISTVIAHRFNAAVMSRFDELVRRFEIEIVPFSYEQATIGRYAYREYGRGSGHRARLNFGDCFSYALASHSHEPLLFKGDDFVHTDVQIASVRIEGR